MSTPLTFLHIPVDLKALYRMNDKRAWAAARNFDEGRALHHVMGEIFGKKSLQPFRLLVPPRKRTGSLYAYSLLPADQLNDTGRTCAPELEAVLDPAAMRAKSLATDFAAGRRLGFDIRICPVRRTDREGNRNASREIDAFLHEALRHGDDKNWMKNNNRTREAVYTDWLAERLGGAASLQPGTTRLARFRRTIKARDKPKTLDHKPKLESPDAVLHGTLTVTNSAAFAEKLCHDIGRHKAYGFGMILLRPPGQQPLTR